jgi:hypothetical protein
MSEILLPAGRVRMSARYLDPNVSYVYGIAVPNIRPEHPTVRSMQYEWDQFDIADVDMTNLPVLANHKEHMEPVGYIAAYEPLKHEARVLMALNPHTFFGNFAENAVATDVYGSMSLSHDFRTKSTVAASSSATLPDGRVDSARPADVTVRKTAIEVSLCKEPARKGAKVLEYCPSKEAMLNQPREFLRRFAVKYGYPEPPVVPQHPRAVGFVTTQIARNTPALYEYVEKQLTPLVQQRLAGVVSNAKFMCTDSILPWSATPTATAGSGHVQMSTNAPPTTSAASSGMHIDAPGSSAPSSATGAPASKAPPTNGMALDAPAGGGAAPPRGLATESTTRSDVTTQAPGEVVDPAAVFAQTIANNAALKKQVDELQAEKQAQIDAALAVKKAEEAKQIKDWQIASQTWLSKTAKELKMSPDEANSFGDVKKEMDEAADALNYPLAKRADMFNKWQTSIVQASKRIKAEIEAMRDNRMMEQARIASEQMKASKSTASFHGGHEQHETTRVQASSSSTSSPSSAAAAKFTQNAFGLTEEDYKMYGPGSSEPNAGEGHVNASKGATTHGRNGARTGDEIAYDDPDAIGKVYASLCKLLPDGSIELPSHEEVVFGGYVIEKRVKRSNTGAEEEFEVKTKNWKSKKNVGLQHLYPHKFAEMMDQTRNYDAKLDKPVLEKMAVTGKAHALMGIIPHVHSKLKKGNFTKNFVYTDPRRKGSEEMSYIDIAVAD